MTRVIVGACVALAFTAGVGAQDKRMAREKMDHMAMEKAYSGCVEGSQTGSYTLTHWVMADAKKSMKKADSMKKDDSMAPAPLALSAAAPSVDLSKHVGHKVTVTGTDENSMNGMATFKVKSLKMIGASCS
jgi:hypothetical protein